MEDKKPILKKKTAHWYAVNTFSGSEDKVKIALEARAKNEKLDKQILEIIVANYIEVKLKKKKDEEVRVEKIKNNFPGYVFVKMIMSDYAWFVVRNTQGVTGFVGSSGKKAKPFPMTQEEIEQVKKLKDLVDDSQYKLGWAVGEKVLIKKGEHADLGGKIKEINTENKTVVLTVENEFQRFTVETEIKFIKKI